MFSNWLSSTQVVPAPSPTCVLRIDELEERVVPTVDLILDFDGGTIQSGQGYRLPSSANGFTFSAFAALPNSDGSAGNRTEQMLQIAAGVRADYAAFDVRVIIDDRGVASPFFDSGDTVIMIVGESSTALGQDNFFGVAPFDVNQDSFRDVGLVFEPLHVAVSSLPLRQIRELTDTISHEAGHTFGLSHTTQADAQGRQLVTTGPQNSGLDSRFAQQALPSEDLGVYSEFSRLGTNVGFNPAQPNDGLTNQTLPGDTPGIVLRTDTFVRVRGTIDFFGDRDAFRFDVPATGSYTVRMVAAAGSAVQPSVTLWSANGDFLGVSGADGTITFTAAAGTRLYAVAGTTFDRQTLVPGGGAIGSYALEIGPAALANGPVAAAQVVGADPNAGGGFGGDAVFDTSGQVTGLTNGVGQSPAVLPLLNQLVIANLQRVFAQPIPPGGPIVAAALTGLADINGDGFLDVGAVVVLRGPRGRFLVFQLIFNGISTSGELIGTPVLIRR